MAGGKTCSSLRRWHDRARYVVLCYPWLVPLVVSVSLSLMLIEHLYGLFRTTSLTAEPVTPLQFPLLLAAFTLVDLTALQSILLVWTAVGRLLRLSRRCTTVLYVISTMLLVVLANVITKILQAYVGDLTRVVAQLQMAGGWKGTLPFIFDCLPPYLPMIGLVSFLVIAGAVLLWLWTRRDSAVWQSPFSLRRQAAFCLVLWLAAIGQQFGLTRSRMQHPVVLNVRRTCLHRPISACIAALTNFDGDSRGWLDFPPDLTPFDSMYHPFAPEIPDNGIDENGIGGDLTEPLFEPISQRPERIVSTPDVIMLVECSFRPDVIIDSEHGPGVMPTVRRLMDTGFYHDQTYSHAGTTVPSLKQMFSGRLIYHDDSLILDFKSFGYQVGYFSTVPGRYGNIDRICRANEADLYFDADSEPNARVNKSLAPASMIIPSSCAIRAFESFLSSGDKEQPLFAFLFLSTLHFPYSHDSELDLVPCDSLSPGEIRPENRAQVVQIYRNAAANLDRHISQILDLVEYHRPSQPGAEPVVMILADHSESLFDDGTLGHGLIVNDIQTRIPFIVVNGWGELPRPMGLTDIRAFLMSLVATHRPSEPRMTTYRSKRGVFQYCGNPRVPLQIGVVTDRGRAIVDCDGQTFTSFDEVTNPVSISANDPGFLRVVHMWESLRVPRGSVR